MGYTIAEYTVPPALSSPKIAIEERPHCCAQNALRGRSMNAEPRVVAKHRLLVQEDGKQQVHICDVHSWNDSDEVEHGVSGKLEVQTRRFTPSKTIKHFPKFRLTLSSKADSSGLIAPFLNRLRSTRQVRSIKDAR